MKLYGSYLNSITRLSKEFVELVLTKELPLEDYFYDESIKLDEGISETFGDTYPSFMKIQRPNESEKQEAYRKDYFENTGNPIVGYLGQIEKQLDKVFSSPDCKIVYPSKSKFQKEDGIEYYLTADYYNGENFFDNFKETIKNKILVSPNSVLLVLPNEQIQNSFPKPYFLIVKPENVLFYKASDIAVFKSEINCDIVSLDGTVEYGTGEVYYFFDKVNYIIAKQDKRDKQGNPLFTINTINGGEFRKHGCSILPAKKVGRKIFESTENGHELRTSDLQDSMVFLRNAIMNYMDLIVEHNFHVASQEWAIGTIDCVNCDGTGKVKGDGKAKTCSVCGGGKKVQGITGNGLDKIVIPLSTELGGKADRVPTQIGGFIQRPETGSKLFDTAFEKNMKRALQPFGLDHLMNTPYNQSGEAKNLDMQEGFGFVESGSQHIETLFSMVLNCIFEMRYKLALKVSRDFERPLLIIPKTFNLNSTQSLQNKLKDATTYSMPDFIVGKYSEQLVEKESGSNSEELLRYKVMKKLDPLPNATFSQRQSSRVILSDVKYVLTNNMDNIITEATQRQENFLYLLYNEQKAIVYGIATEYLSELGENINNNVQAV